MSKKTVKSNIDPFCEHKVILCEIMGETTLMYSNQFTKKQKMMVDRFIVIDLSDKYVDNVCEEVIKLLLEDNVGRKYILTRTWWAISLDEMNKYFEKVLNYA